MARTVMSWSQAIWQERRTQYPREPFSSIFVFSAWVIREGSPLTNSMRQVVQRALPPQACRISTPASCSMALTRRLPDSTSRWENPQRSVSACRYVNVSNSTHDGQRPRAISETLTILETAIARTQDAGGRSVLERQQRVSGTGRGRSRSRSGSSSGRRA